MELTEFQQYALSEIRKQSGQWFSPYDLYYMVKRPEHTCRILVEKGYLEMRYTNNTYPEFREKAATVER